MAVVMFITTNYSKSLRLDAIRKLSGNIKVQTKSDDIIIEIASRKDQIVFSSTNTTSASWDDTIEDTPLVIDASNCFTAAEILYSFGTVQNDQLAEKLMEKANATIQTINRNSPNQITSAVSTTEGFNGDNLGTFN